MEKRQRKTRISNRIQNIVYRVNIMVLVDKLNFELKEDFMKLDQNFEEIRRLVNTEILEYNNVH